MNKMYITFFNLFVDKQKGRILTSCFFFIFSLPLTNIMHEQDSRLIRTTNLNGAASLIKIIIKTALNYANCYYN